MKEFVHLHNHTQYSLLDRLRLKTMIARAKELACLPAPSRTGSCTRVSFFKELSGESICIGCEVMWLQRPLRPDVRGKRLIIIWFYCRKTISVIRIQHIVSRAFWKLLL